MELIELKIEKKYGTEKTLALLTLLFTVISIAIDFKNIKNIWGVLRNIFSVVKNAGAIISAITTIKTIIPDVIIEIKDLDKEEAYAVLLFIVEQLGKILGIKDDKHSTDNK